MGVGVIAAGRRRSAGGDGTPGIAYRYVGVEIVATGSGYVSCAQLSLFEVGSSADRALAGTMAMSFAQGANGPSAMNDNNSSTFMDSANSAAAFKGVVYCDFGSGVEYDIQKIGWRVRPGGYESQSPQIWRLIGKHNSGDDWQHIAYLTTKTWTSTEYYEETVTPYGDPTLAGGYRYFRFTCTAKNGANPYMGEQYIRETSGGPTRAWYYKTVTQDNFLAGGYEGSRMFNGGGVDGWYATGALPLKCTLDFGTGLRVNPHSITSKATDQPGLAWNTWKVEVSNDGSSWTQILNPSSQSGWSSGEERTFTV